MSFPRRRESLSRGLFGFFTADLRDNPSYRRRDDHFCEMAYSYRFTDKAMKTDDTDWKFIFGVCPQNTIHPTIPYALVASSRRRVSLISGFR